MNAINQGMHKFHFFSIDLPHRRNETRQVELLHAGEEVGIRTIFVVNVLADSGLQELT
jgi:hypothetical protein